MRISYPKLCNKTNSLSLERFIAFKGYIFISYILIKKNINLEVCIPTDFQYSFIYKLRQRWHSGQIQLQVVKVH